MIEVQINEDISAYEEKITPIMTMRQCIITGITVTLVAPIFMIVQKNFGYQIAGYSIIPFVSIGFAFAFVKYQGMNFKDSMKAFILWCFVKPRKRIYTTENVYDYINHQ